MRFFIKLFFGNGNRVHQHILGKQMFFDRYGNLIICKYGMYLTAAELLQNAALVKFCGFCKHHDFIGAFCQRANGFDAQQIISHKAGFFTKSVRPDKKLVNGKVLNAFFQHRPYGDLRFILEISAQ